MHPILVTGASGRTGNAVARRLLQAGYGVRAVAHRRDVCSDKRASLGSRKTFGNALKAFAQFMSVPLRPGLKPHRYETQHELPMPPLPSYNMANQISGFTIATWTDETATAIKWFANAASAPRPGGLSLARLIGSEFANMSAIFRRNLAEGRAAIVAVVAECL